MASMIKVLNPREEERELDDKLMELGLLEPEMTLQEKRELASVVLESTRMAEEQRKKITAEEEWESSLISPKATGSNESIGLSESPELIELPISKLELEKPSTSRTASQRRRDEVGMHERETTLRGRNRSEREYRERRGKRERDEDIPTEREVVVLEVEEGDEEGEKVDVEERKGRDESIRMLNFTRRKREEDYVRRECEVGRPQKKLLGVEKKKGRGEVEETKGLMEDKEKGIRGAEKRAKKEMEVGQEGDGKVLDASNEESVGVPGAAGGFYGPSCSSNVKELNPLRSELHGYSRKRLPTRNHPVSLLQLAREDIHQKKKSLNEIEIGELVLDEETSLEKSSCDKTLVKSFNNNKTIVEAGDLKNKPLPFKQHTRGRKIAQEKVEEGKPCIDIIHEDDDWETPQGGKIWIKESRKRNGVGFGPSGLRETTFRNLKGNSELNSSLLAGAGKLKRREQDVEADIEEGSELEDDEKGGEEPNADGRSELSDFILEGKKKRRLAKGTSSKKWVDVVIFPNSSNGCASESGVQEIPKSDRKILLPPNKRWRRVKRKAKSSFGSGSEVDEWISSEEEQKPKGMAISKEQLIARFDKQLNCLEDALKAEHLKKASVGSKYSRCKICERKSTMKVPPGFQEPDSDDEWNLWKICFSKLPSESSDKKLKQHLKKEKLKPDATPFPSVKRSQVKQVGDSSSSRSVSKSPVSFEDASTSMDAVPEEKDKASVLDDIPGDDASLQGKSLLDEVVLFDNIIQSQSSVTRGTQTFWEYDGKSSGSGSQRSSLPSGQKSKEGSVVAKPVWDLLEINSDGEEVTEKSEKVSSGGEEGVTETFKNVTVRRGQSHSPEYMPLMDEDVPSIHVSVTHRESVGKASPSLDESVAVPSPVMTRGSRRGKLKAVKDRKGGQSGEEDRVQLRGKTVEAHVSDDNEIEKVQILPPEEEDDVPKDIACPLCNKKFPMSEIEVHASECNQEEEEPLPRILRDGGRRRLKEDGEVAGAVSSLTRRCRRVVKMIMMMNLRLPVVHRDMLQDQHHCQHMYQSVSRRILSLITVTNSHIRRGMWICNQH
ncbi:myosin heavy chain, cardiac muscle isoform-like isoform X2 [Hetaerina americana]|uniref:myosin heavy chain, cardiac muscle isoform-like isoform X2 n=1 Tax=Hetaerina americana TaxID=62018 RepID=UPI003A7F3365